MSDTASSVVRPLVFTVFTPTYNRAHTLPRLFASLVSQTFESFEWLVVDDGSEDGTAELFEGFKATASFPIRYVRQANAGKHVAFDHAVDLAAGEFFLPVDSDDAIVPNALERLAAIWSEIPRALAPRYSGVTAACMSERGEVVSTPLPRVPLDCSAQEAVFRWRLRGERFGFHRTEILRKIRFPVGRQLKFVPEGVLWFAIGREFSTRFVDEPLRLYFTSGSDRLTVMASARKGSGIGYYCKDLLLHHSEYAALDPVSFVKAAIQFVRFRKLIPRTLRAGQDSLPLKSLLLIILAAPVAIALQLADLLSSRYNHDGPASPGRART